MKKVKAIVLLTSLIIASCSSKHPSINPSEPRANRDIIASKAVVTTANPIASQIGIEVLKSGGNAFDAAVAVGFALGVVEPNASGIGGGGFAILYEAKSQKTYVVDFRETAPKKATNNFYQSSNSANVNKDIGWFSAGIPGQIAGMNLINTKFGTKKWDDLIQPTIEVLKEGVPVNRNLNSIIEEYKKRMLSGPSKDFFITTFFKKNSPLEPGMRYYNNDLLQTLEIIAKDGADSFYNGEIADKIANSYSLYANSWITKYDLEEYQAILREPIKQSYRDIYEIVTTPAPTGGATLLEILNIIDNFDLKNMGYGSHNSIHTIIEAQKLAFADRNLYMADPYFIDVPTEKLISKTYAKNRSNLINMNKAADKINNISTPIGGSTTSFSIIDYQGNMITITQTINSFFGGATVIPYTGIIMNNEMDDFNIEMNTANSVEPGKRPRSSIAPTIVFKNNKPFMTLGSPGGPRIITAVLNVLINVIDYDMDIQKAIESPRIHNPNANITQLEHGFPVYSIELLKNRGHQLEVKSKIIPFFGGVQGIVINDNELHGGADVRRAAQAEGY